MIDLAELRAKLATELDTRIPDSAGVKVYPRGVDGVFTSPAVVFGQPTVEFNVQPCSIHRYELPVAVVVERQGLDETTTQHELEDAWMVVAGAIEDTIAAGTLPGAAHKLTRADFGSFQIQGQGYPAQVLTIELFG